MKGVFQFMDIKPYDKTIREVLLSGRQFSIPRFQREYSWENKHYKEFFEDMINCLVIESGNILTSSYFFGTMLFVGNYAEGTDQLIEVVDGQQRLTTITILFSALSDHFNELGENTLSKQIFKYIMTTDDNGKDVRILQSNTHYPYFAYYIQDREKMIKQKSSSEEELCIEEAYNYLYSQLSEKNIKSLLKLKHGKSSVDPLDYVQILKAIRDQVLSLTFVSISTKDKDQANMIFEILNAKGKRLADIDLIKNKVFEILKNAGPVDFADDYWNKIKKVLNNGGESVGFATFYRHYWCSKYKKSISTRMYDDFNKQFKAKSDIIVREFVKDMYKNSLNYMKIINPKREDYDNRKEYLWLVQTLNVINNYFNIVQVRIALLALYELKEKSIIDHGIFKKTILYLEGFHFAYNAITSGRSNRFETLYSTFAIELRKCKTKEEAKVIIQTKLIDQLEKIYPSYEEFSTNFVKLTYSTRQESSNNIKSRYIINKFNCMYLGRELFVDDESVEHILPEEREGLALNIGNLISLEISINREAGNVEYKDKIEIYKKTKYNWVTEFVNQHPDWEENKIDNRALEMAKEYYTKILNKTIPISENLE